jgi:hypothetical protein
MEERPCSNFMDAPSFFSGRRLAVIITADKTRKKLGSG